VAIELPPAQQAYRKRAPRPGEATITVVAGREGHSIYINEIRVAGPKPWGGGLTVCEFNVPRSEIDEALQQVWHSDAECYVRPSQQNADKTP
jgi:hypothetical protein